MTFLANAKDLGHDDGSWWTDEVEKFAAEFRIRISGFADAHDRRDMITSFLQEKKVAANARLEVRHWTEVAFRVLYSLSSCET